MMETKLIVDGHVHIYNCYDLYEFFDMAIKNMDNMHSSIYSDDNFNKVVILTEGMHSDYFSRFKMNSNMGKQSKYKFENTKEDNSLVLTKNNQHLCYILAGRQIVTREKLEILSIASNQKIEDGLPIEEVINKLFDKKEIVVLAWGVGKWFFKRGKIIKHIIEKYHSPFLFIGDSGARPSFWSVPKLFKLAKKYNIGIISGSDPLPFAGEQSRVGKYGFLIEGDFRVNKPAESLCNLLIENRKNIKCFGRQDCITLFMKNQARMLQRKLSFV